MKNPVVHFEIPVRDFERAISFYESVFGYELKRVEVDGNQMAFFPADENANGISGALAHGDSYLPGKQGARIYFGVTNIDGILTKVLSLGGKSQSHF